MANDIRKQIVTLLADVECRNRRYHKGVIVVGVIYALLLAFVIGYTWFISHQVSKLATTDNLSQMAVNKFREHLPEMRSAFTQKMEPAAAAIAQRSVSAGIQLIPNASAYAKSMINDQVDLVLQDFDKENMPVIEQILDEAIQTVLTERKTQTSDKTLAQAISSRADERIDKELDALLNRDFYDAVTKLTNDVKNLGARKSTKALTSKEKSERNAVFCWLRLNEIAECGGNSSILLSLSNVTGDAARKLGEPAPVKEEEE